MKIKSLFLIVMALLLCVSLVSCSKRVKRDEAKEMTELLLDAVEAADFEKAKTYLHPDRAFDVAKLFNSIEERENVDFQKGIEIKKYTNFSSSLYDSEVDGSDYELDMDILVDGVIFELSIEVVRNDDGYGIYDIELDR